MPPALRLPDRILISDYQRGFHLFAKTKQAVLGVLAKNQPDIPLRKGFGDIGNAFREKCVVPKIGHAERSWRKEHHHGLTESVGGFDRNIESGIIDAALRSLHPVDNAFPRRIWRPGISHGDARIAREFKKSIHSRRRW